MGCQRSITVDVMKGLGIILVVLGHTIHNSDLHEWIYTFHMPLFFIVAGLFLKTGDDIYLKRCKTILIPYLFFAVITFLYWRFWEIRFRPINEGVDANTHFFDIFWQTNRFQFNIVLWFLPCLFITTILLNAVTSIIKKRIFIFCICLLWITVASLYMPDTKSFWVKETWYAFPFVTFGWFIGKLAFKVENMLTNVPWFYKMTALIPLVAIMFLPHGGSMLSSQYPNGYAYFFVMALICVSAVYVLSTLLVTQKWLSWLGCNTLIIMCLHDPLKRIVIKFLSYVMHQTSDELRESVFLSFFVTAIVISVLIPICKLINKRMPWLLGRF